MGGAQTARLPPDGGILSVCGCPHESSRGHLTKPSWCHSARQQRKCELGEYILQHSGAPRRPKPNLCRPPSAERIRCHLSDCLPDLRRQLRHRRSKQEFGREGV